MGKKEITFEEGLDNIKGFCYSLLFCDELGNSSGLGSKSRIYMDCYGSTTAYNKHERLAKEFGLSITYKWTIPERLEYDENDNLCHLSEFILDLDPECKTVNLLFECSIKKDKLLDGIKNRGTMPIDKFVTNHIKDYLQKKFIHLALWTI